MQPYIFKITGLCRIFQEFDLGAKVFSKGTQALYVLKLKLALLGSPGGAAINNWVQIGWSTCRVVVDTAKWRTKTKIKILGSIPGLGKLKIIIVNA